MKGTSVWSIWVIWIYFNQLFALLAGWQAVCPSVCHTWQSYWTLHTNSSTKFFHTCHAKGHHCPLPLYTTFSGLSIAWATWLAEREMRIYWMCLRSLRLACIWRIYEPVRLKLGAVRDTTDLYILTLVWVTLTLIWGHMDVKKHEVLSQ